jgi:hypothetical protein
VTHYDYMILGYNVEFDSAGPRERRVEFTDEHRADPRFAAFFQMLHEHLLEQIRADMKANGPGTLFL